MLEELQRLIRRHLQDLRDVLSSIQHLQRLAVIALAVADLAGYIDIRQEVHLNLHQTVAAARFAAPALDIK